MSGVLVPGQVGYFERIERDQVIGWAREADGRPAPVTILVNGSIAASVEAGPPSAYRSNPPEHGRFQVPLRLSPGDRVEIVHRSLGSALPGGVRLAVDERWSPRIALVAPVKQEAPHLLEWLAFHRALGVQSFVLADNGGTDGTSDVLRALDEAGVIQRRDWLGKLALQLPFYREAVPALIGAADVCVIVDADEFLRPLNGRHDVTAAVAELFACPDVSAVAMSSATYGSSGRIEPGEGLVQVRFARRAPDPHDLNFSVKSMVRPERFVGMANPHVVEIASGDYVDDRGVPVAWQRPAVNVSVGWNSLRVDHFVLKSRQEFEIKAKRGRATTGDPARFRNADFFLSRDRNEVFDPMPADLVERTKAEMAEIRARLARSSRLWRELSLST